MIRKNLGGLLASLFVAACNQSTSAATSEPPVSDISADETVVFFQTSGWLNAAADAWHVPVHGWIYEPQDSTVRLAAAKAILKERFDLETTEETNDNFAARLNLLIADNERGKKIVVNVAGKNHVLDESRENGHFETTIVVPLADAEEHVQDGLLKIAAITADADSREFSGSARLLEPTGLSVISDIDDTVKISNVRDRRSLLEQTFLLDFAAAPGMAATYRKWSDSTPAFHYVSSSPWQLYNPLLEFLQKSDFPWATFSLKAIRFRDETLLDLFKEGTETKPAAIRGILDRYPDRQFVLVGDSGEQDPEVYSALMLERPEQIVQIAIRNVTAESRTDDRFTRLFSEIDAASWHLFDDPETIPPLGGNLE